MGHVHSLRVPIPVNSISSLPFNSHDNNLWRRHQLYWPRRPKPSPQQYAWFLLLFTLLTGCQQLASYDKETRRIVADSILNVQTATSDAQKARLERDDAIKALKAAQREDSAWKDEARTCKSAVRISFTSSCPWLLNLLLRVGSWIRPN
jgi:hypothetical protein